MDVVVARLHPKCSRKDLGDIAPYVEDSGEGRWTLDEAIKMSVPAPVLAASLFARFSSRQKDSPQMKMVAALRNQFGGHAVSSSGAQGDGDTPGADVLPPVGG